MSFLVRGSSVWKLHFMLLFPLCLGSPGMGHTQQRTFQVPVLLVQDNSTQDLHGTSQTQVLNPPLCPSLHSRLCSSTRCNAGCMSAVQAVSLQLIILMVLILEREEQVPDSYCCSDQAQQHHQVCAADPCGSWRPPHLG